MDAILPFHSASLFHRIVIVGICFLMRYAVAERVKDTKFGLDRGFYRQSIAVGISTETSDANIYYTLDGSAPTPTDGIRYREPISISTTTVLRAAAFKVGMSATNVDTMTYIFPREVLNQSGDGLPQTWGLRHGLPVVADYEMDPDVTESSVYRDRLLEGLLSIPTVSLALSPDDWLDPKSGIYANSMERGAEWERHSSVEMIFPERLDGKSLIPEKSFQADCGLRIQGGWNRRPEESPKHSLRLLFKKKYGRGKLRQPLFAATSTTSEYAIDQNAVQSFDTLILRGGNNNTWLHRGSDERVRGDYVRDQWMRDSFASMGQVSARGRFVHLFINGLYWGVYNLTERPCGSFLAARYGGSADDYDARNGDKMVSGDDVAWQEIMEIVNEGIDSEVAYAAVSERLELANFADYMLLNLYGANGDYDGASNWYAGRPRHADGKFRFFVWDGERTNEDAEKNVIDYDSDQSPARIFQKLRVWAPFRRLFAERVQLHCFGQGALTPAASAARFDFHARSIQHALVAESARWGDYRRDVHPHEDGPFALYTTDDFWHPEVARFRRDFFPKRTNHLISQLRAAGLYPTK